MADINLDKYWDRSWDEMVRRLKSGHADSARVVFDGCLETATLKGQCEGWQKADDVFEQVVATVEARETGPKH